MLSEDIASEGNNDSLAEMLLSDTKEHRDKAMEIIDRQYRTLILGIIRSNGVRYDEEEDVIQEVYLVIVKTIDKKEKIINMPAFLKKVTSTQVLMLKRTGGRNAKKMRKLRLLSHVANEDPNAVPGIYEESRRKLYEAIEELPEFLRTLIQDRYWGGKSFADISVEQHRTVKALDHQTRVARLELYKKLAPYFR